MSGVPSSLYSGRGPNWSVLNRQATSSLLKLDASIWLSGEYRVPLISPEYAGHSPSFVEGSDPWPDVCGVHRQTVSTTIDTVTVVRNICRNITRSLAQKASETMFAGGVYRAGASRQIDDARSHRASSLTRI